MTFNYYRFCHHLCQFFRCWKMSAVKRRCIVKKLDFENCIVTNIKTKARGRKRLRARITREFEDFDCEQNEIEDSTPNPPETDERRIPSPKPTSPVLIKNPTKRIGSPVLFNKRKMVFGGSQTLPRSDDEETPTRPGSPVFKIKTKFFNMSPSQSNQTKSATSQAVIRMNSTDLFVEANRTSERSHCSYQIEDSTQESKLNIQISSFESEDTKGKTSDRNYSVDTKESSPEVSRSSFVFNPRDSLPEVSKNTDNSFEMMEFSKKNYKKNSLLGKLQKVLRKQASEKLIWQHQKRKNMTVNLQKLVVASYWTVDCNYYLKCFPMMDTEVLYLIVDFRWVPNIKKVQPGSLLQIHPPWHQLVIKECNITVLLNLVCLEVLDENFSVPIESTEKPTSFESIPVDEFLKDQKLFTRSLFSSQKSAFLLIPSKKRC